jgi:hypothetical protein
MTIVIIGATSAIAQEVARRYASRQARLVLVGREHARCEIVAQDLRVRGAERVDVIEHDLVTVETIPAAVAALSPLNVDLCLIAHGTMPNEHQCETDLDLTLRSIHVNATSVIAWMHQFVQLFTAQGRGTLAVISSPAGERGRAANFSYGAPKAAVSQYASGLRGRLQGTGVRVVTILPGPTDTPMTAALPRNRPFSSVRTVAAAIVDGLDGKAPMIWSPWYLRGVMFILKLLPESVFHRIKI